MDVIEHNRLSNIILGAVILLFFVGFFLTFHSHSRVFNTEHDVYPKMVVKRPLPSVEWYYLLRTFNSEQLDHIVPCCYRIKQIDLGGGGSNIRSLVQKVIFTATLKLHNLFQTSPGGTMGENMKLINFRMYLSQIAWSLCNKHKKYDTVGTIPNIKIIARDKIDTPNIQIRRLGTGTSIKCGWV